MADAWLQGLAHADVAIPEPTDAFWPKWAGYGIVGGAAAYTLNPEQYSTTSIFSNLVTESVNILAKMSFPKPWIYTYRPPMLDPINQPQRGNDPDNLPDWKGPVRWGLIGLGLYRVYDEYKSHINNMQPIILYPKDNTLVKPKFVPYERR